jgi:hypothetical protein
MRFRVFYALDVQRVLSVHGRANTPHMELT